MKKPLVGCSTKELIEELVTRKGVKLLGVDITESTINTLSETPDRMCWNEEDFVYEQTILVIKNKEVI